MLAALLVLSQPGRPCWSSLCIRRRPAREVACLSGKFTIIIIVRDSVRVHQLLQGLPAEHSCVPSWKAPRFKYLPRRRQLRLHVLDPGFCLGMGAQEAWHLVQAMLLLHLAQLFEDDGCGGWVVAALGCQAQADGVCLCLSPPVGQAFCMCVTDGGCTRPEACVEVSAGAGCLLPTQPACNERGRTEVHPWQALVQVADFCLYVGV